MDLFNKLQGIKKKLFDDGSNSNWWETNNDYEFNRNAIGPNNTFVDEKELYLQTQKSDLERLKKFS